MAGLLQNLLACSQTPLLASDGTTPIDAYSTTAWLDGRRAMGQRRSFAKIDAACHRD